LDALRQLLAQHAPDTSKVVYQPPILPKGMFIVPVGPIHAGIIEAGHFPFHVAGEVVEELPVTLGYKHRGIEKLFETHYMLMDGWRLAEKVSGDSAVAHVTAYCQAVEDLAKTELPLVAYQWRTMLLELERMYNHISDIGLLAVGIAYEQAAARLATLRELFVHYINLPLSGHRFLRGLNYPGEVKIPQEIAWNEIRLRLDAVVEEALEIGLKLLQMPNTRERMIGTGSLTKDDGRYAAGLAARASGWYSHDFRLRHPSTVYRSETIQQIIRRTFFSEDVFPPRKVNVYKYDLKGDVFARLAVRVAELETSLYLVQELIKILKDGVLQSSLQVNILDALTLTPENAFGLGYAEGWRGAVIYMVFKGSENTIARCDVCDPSLINWHLFRKAVERQEIEGKPQKKNVSENILADFPLINKSFNLSYAGHDL
jgi:Ni,Fe-hydrogenase III large subunit